MNLLKFTQKDETNNSISRIVFENEHIRVEEKEYAYKIIAFDSLGVDAMHNCFQISPAKHITTSSIEELELFYQKSIEDNQEGIMIKNLDKEYRAGKRVGYMYKMKPTSEDVDVVIVAAEMGRGKRGGYFSSFYVAVQDKQGELKTVGKVGSGLKEESENELSIQKFTKILRPLTTSYDSKLNITYFKPEIIVQVSYQDLQQSQTTQSKYALRFPKIVALRNQDKTVEDITSLDELLSYHNIN